MPVIVSVIATGVPGSPPPDFSPPVRIDLVSEAPVTGPQPPPAPGQRPARYPRTANGLIGSLLVTLLFVGAFVAFRALNRDNLEVKPEPVDYLARVSGIQQSGLDVVYPAGLPAGWIATSATFIPGDDPAFGVGMLTDDLLTTYVDEETAEGEELSVPGSVARTWRSFTDAGGDRAYAATLGDDEVLVYGSASEADLRQVIESLTTERR
jgi:hypothetical protein